MDKSQKHKVKWKKQVAEWPIVYGSVISLFQKPQQIPTSVDAQVLHIKQCIICPLVYFKSGASPLAQTVKTLPAMQENRVWSLVQEDTLEKGMATHSSILDWRIPWTEEPGGLQSTGSHRVGHDWSDFIHTHAIHIKCLWRFGMLLYATGALLSEF